MCIQCLREETNQMMEIARTSTLSWRRAVSLYHEGFIVPQIAEIIGNDPLTVAYWIEEYA